MWVCPIGARSWQGSSAQSSREQEGYKGHHRTIKMYLVWVSLFEQKTLLFNLYLSFMEIELIGCVVTLQSVEHTVVIHERFESLFCIVTVEPIDHVASVRSTQTSYALSIQKVVFFETVIQANDQVMVWMGAPVTLDRIGKSLTVSYHCVLMAVISCLVLFSYCIYLWSRVG